MIIGRRSMRLCLLVITRPKRADEVSLNRQLYEILDRITAPGPI
jgi:hypothetical protein